MKSWKENWFNLHGSVTQTKIRQSEPVDIIFYWVLVPLKNIRGFLFWEKAALWAGGCIIYGWRNF